MGQLGFQELIVIFVIALLVFGPKKLPELGKSLGKGLREFRKATDELKTTWEDQVRDVADPIKDATKDATQEIRAVGSDLKTDYYASPASTPAPESTIPTTAVPKEQV
jgi:sec-independent protein translocase protein TatA